MLAATERPARARATAPLAALVLAAWLPSQGLSNVFTGAPTGDARTQGAHRRALAVAADGSMWSLVRYNDKSGPAPDVHLLLLRSTDGGATWTRANDTPTKGDRWGAIVTGTDCDTLHVAWHARDGGPAASLYHQTLNTRTNTWNGKPTRLFTGVNSNNQFLAHDVEVTPQGTVVVAFGTHRQGPWTGELVVKKPGKPWSKRFRINVGTYGPNADLQAVGETVHVAYRSNFGLYGTFYRAFDTAKMAFVQNRDVPVGPNGNRGLKAGNINCIAADRAANLYVIYNRNGSIDVSYAKAGGYGTWTPIHKITDGAIRGGNVTNHNFTLATGGGLVFAVYSKQQDGYKKLHYQIFSNGKKVGPEITAATSTETKRFWYVNGLRSTQSRTAMMATVSGTTTSLPGGSVSLYRHDVGARTLRFGTACANATAGAPAVDGRSLPKLGTTFSVEITGLPGNVPAFLLLGTRCQRPPLSLAIIGRPGCFLYQDIPFAVAFATGTSGTVTRSFPLANNPSWKGVALYWQSAVMHPGGLLATNGLLSALE